MRYAAVINLDYDSHPETSLRYLWEEIKEGMIQAGFRAEGRMFTIDLSGGEAAALARGVTENLEGYLEFHRKHIYKHLKCFFKFNMDCTTNLLLPAVEQIRISDQTAGSI